MRRVYEPEWRTSKRWKRRFYSKYMRWLERAGYVVVVAVVAAFILAFNYPVDDLIKAEDVKLTPFASTIKAADKTEVVAVMAEDFAEVQSGQPLLELVEGEANVKAYDDWLHANTLVQGDAKSPLLLQLQDKYPKPKTRLVLSPAKGTFRFDVTKKSFEADDDIARVVDYNDIRLSASLAGDTVVKAQVGQIGRITNLNLGSGTGTVFRGSSAHGATLSTKLLSEDLRKQMATALQGKAVRLRDDVPLRISDVTEVQVDARVADGAAADASAAMSLDPPVDYAIPVTVTAGTPMATAQAVDLPNDVAQKAQETIQASLKGKTVRGMDGKVRQIDSGSDVQILVKLKAKDAAPAGEAAIEGSMLKRTYDATLKVDAPPAFLIEAIRNADRTGTDVTARVELRTGSRPIAFILLKKS